MHLHLVFEDHHWIHRLIANSARLCLNLGIWERQPLIVMQKVKDIQKKVQDQTQIKNFFNSKTKPKTDNSKIDCSIYDNNGNNDIVEIETPSSSRMEKVQTAIPTTYYDEKKMFAQIRWASKQVLCVYSGSSCE